MAIMVFGAGKIFRCKRLFSEFGESWVSQLEREICELLKLRR